MLYIDLNDHSIEVLQAKKGLVGSGKIIACTRKEIPEGLIINGLIIDTEKVKEIFSEIFQSAYPKPIMDETAALTISDKQVITHRFHLNELVKNENLSSKIIDLAKNTIPYDPVELVNFYRIVYSSASETDVVYTAAAKNTVMHYSRFIKSLGLNLTNLFPRSFAVYEWIKKYITGNEIVVYSSIDKGFADYLVFDKFGLISAIYKKLGNASYGNVTKGFIDEIEKEKSVKISKIYIGGFDSMELHLTDVASVVNIPAVKLNEMIDEIYQKNNINIDTGGVSKMLFIHSVSSLLLQTSEFPPNFASDIDKILDALPESPKVEEKQAKESSDLEISTGDAKFETDLNEMEGVQEPQSRKIIPDKKMIMIFVTIITAVIVFFGINFIIGNKGQISLPIIAQPTVTPSPTAIPTVTPTPTIDPALKRGDLKISVQNGTTKTGYAKDIADYLEKAGYKKITKANADKDTYEKTVIKIKSAKKNYLPLLVSDLKAKADTTSVEDLEDGNSSDIVIILGAK